MKAYDLAQIFSAGLMEESDLWKYEYKTWSSNTLCKQNVSFQWKGSESSKSKENSNIRIKGPICSFHILGIIHYEFVPPGWPT
jgi:hypothetical protein